MVYLGRLSITLICAAALHGEAVGCEVTGKALITQGVRGLVYGTLRDSELVLSNGRDERILAVDHHGRYHAELSEGTWTVIRVAPSAQKYLQIGQKLRIPAQKRSVKIDIYMQRR
jgi:hypothetical protein